MRSLQVIQQNFSKLNHFRMWFFAICAIFAKQCHSFGESFVRLRLQNTSFLEGREIGVAPSSNSGSLVHLFSTLAVISNVSITSRLKHGSCLFGCSNCMFQGRDCHFSDLANRFSHFSGGSVEMEVMTFKRSVRPITMDFSDTCQDEKRAARREPPGDFTGTNCIFNGSRAQRGGAIEMTSRGVLTLNRCQFIGCVGTGLQGGWGVAVYAEVSSFTYNGCTAKDMDAKYSVIHIQKGAPYGEFNSVTLEGDTFSNIKITAPNDGVPESDIQCGGAGLAIMYSSQLYFKKCNFSGCSFTNTGGQKKRAGALLLEHRTSGSYDAVNVVNWRTASFQTRPARLDVFTPWP